MSEKKELIAIVSSSTAAPGVLSLQSASLGLPCELVLASPYDQNIKETLERADHIIFRMGPKSFPQYKLLLSKLEGRLYAELKKVIRAFDKIETFEILSKSGIPTPRSWKITNRYLYDGKPFVAKIAKGNQGNGVELIDSQVKLNEFFEIYSDEDEFLAQEYIGESHGKDKRLFIIGDKVVAAMERLSGSDDFRANLHQGGEGKAYLPTTHEESIALQAIKAFGLEYGGVDIIDSNQGPLVLEVNPSPGFGISQVTSVDVANKILEYMIGVKND